MRRNDLHGAGHLRNSTFGNDSFRAVLGRRDVGFLKLRNVKGLTRLCEKHRCRFGFDGNDQTRFDGRGTDRKRLDKREPVAPVGWELVPEVAEDLVLLENGTLNHQRGISRQRVGDPDAHSQPDHHTGVVVAERGGLDGQLTGGRIGGRR